MGVLVKGDLGQTYDSNITLTHYEQNPNKGQTVLYVGDLSYADNYPFHDNVRWDTWGRFVERSVAYQPWIWTAGNHEIDFVPEIVSFRVWMYRRRILSFMLRVLPLFVICRYTYKCECCVVAG